MFGLVTWRNISPRRLSREKGRYISNILNQDLYQLKSYKRSNPISEIKKWNTIMIDQIKEYMVINLSWLNPSPPCTLQAIIYD